MIPTNEHDPLSSAPSCKNCGAAHWPGEKYCANCGQKIFTGPPTIWTLIADFFESLFDIDNRVFRTLRDLVVPGKLTNQYLAGRQKPYLNPLKFFFISTVLMLGSAAIFTTSEVEETFTRRALDDRLNAYRAVFTEELDTAIDSIKLSYPAKSLSLATDSLRNLFSSREQDTIKLIHFEYSGGLAFEPVVTSFASKDVYTMSPKEIVDKYEIKGWLSRMQLKQVIQIDTMNSRGLTVLFGQLIWGILFVIPFCALLLKLLYIRRNRLLVEHVIFSLHIHTFLFLLLTVGFLIFYFWRVPYGTIFAGIAIVFYFPAALKRVYKQSWKKTLLKMSLLFFSYLFLVFVCALISVAIAVAMY